MTVTAGPDLDRWQRCLGVARDQGLAPALAELGFEAFGPGGHAVLPAGAALPPGAVVVREANLPGGPVVLVRGGAGRADPGRGAAVVWLRLGLSQGLLDACLTYLGERESGDTTLLRRQLVQGSIAQAVTGQLEVHAELVANAPFPRADLLPHLHAKLSEVDRELLRLLGASGYLAGGPGEVADVSELLAACAPGDRV
ncbi:DUF2786 domain-containing protein [Amycolatopsis anabasis]|uniref:DUF2786 domain-containing protein n=1 Tax=Amycolatopsis anabasis TaxID=1840409 RepID=UPI00131B4300|nr:DUF2786 domain-containing protein [Amycolatopsis anabasis]